MTATLKKWGLIAWGFAIAAAGIFALGKRKARQEAADKANRQQLETRRRMDDADVSRGDSAADLDWLRDRSKR